MNARRIAYWVATVLIAFVFLSGGVMQSIGVAPAVQGITELGYPGYFATILGVWKILGALVVLAPRSPLLKEWAYAGMAFNMTSAAASHAAIGHPTAKVVTPLVILGIVAASWALRPASRKLPITPAAPATLAEAGV